MNTKEKYDLAGIVMDHALKSGAKEVSVSINDSRRSDIEIRDQKIDKLIESVRNGLTIELFVDGKYSVNSTSRLKKEELLRFVDEAIASTKYLAEDEFRSLPDPDLYYKGGGDDLNVLDKNLDSVDAKTKIELARQVHDEAFNKDKRILSVTSGYSDSLSSRILMTSNGFRGEASDTNVSLVADVSVQGETSRPSELWYETSIFLDRLIKTGIGSKALDRVLKKLGPKKIRSGKYPVIIENRAVSNVLRPVYSALTGSSIYQKRSFLAGKENQAVASKVLTVYDDPFLASGAGSQFFDSEGLASVKRPVIEGGILKNFYIDTYYGKKLKLKPTSGEATNLIFSTGDKNLEELIGSMDRGILITGFNGGNCNGSTGDFSYGIEGFYIEKGKPVHPVNEMNITGNMNQFWFNLAELGNDVLEGQAFRTPSMLFSSADLSGI